MCWCFFQTFYKITFLVRTQTNKTSSPHHVSSRTVLRSKIINIFYITVKIIN
jgi:hypothetical protein